MSPHLVAAVLTDSAGMLLLVRRKGSLLWTLPGGEIRGPVSLEALLVSICRRQVGVAPDLVEALREFNFGGRRVAVGRDEILHERARACGRIETVGWFRSDALPFNLDPLARMAIALWHDRGPVAAHRAAVVGGVALVG